MGTLIIDGTYTYYDQNEDITLNTGYEHSQKYYEDVNSYYKAVYNVFYSEKAPTKSELDYLNTFEGYYYFLQTDSLTTYSNAPLPSSGSYLPKASEQIDLFYQTVASVHRIDSDSGVYYRNNEMYFSDQLPEGDVVLIGLSSDLLKLKTDLYLTEWKKQNLPFLQTMAFAGLGILVAMGVLAYTAGRKPYSNDIHYNVLDHIYLDLYLVLWVLVETVLVGFFELFYDVLGDASMLMLIKFVAIISGLLGLIYWMMVIKRLKSRTFFSHTFVGLLWRVTFGRLFTLIYKNFLQVKDGPFHRLPLFIALGFLAFNALSIILGALLTAGLGFVGFLIGSSFYLGGIGLLAIYLIYQDQQLDLTIKGLKRIQEGELDYKINLRGTPPFLELAKGINNVTSGLKAAVEQEIKSERLKTELITNVSHDLKTPLTSIITYVDLLKTEGLDASDAPHYLDVLDQKSQRLKQLTEDLFEAAKASSGSLTVDLSSLSLMELLQQALAEYEDKFEAAKLTVKLEVLPEDLHVLADGRHLWRVLDNLLQNALKYAAPNTRLYIEGLKKDNLAELTLKNISENPLNIPASELTQRFKRGDTSRTTDGSGLGLSIAEGLTLSQGGEFALHIDGDLFKVVLRLPLAE